jgi:integrase
MANLAVTVVINCKIAPGKWRRYNVVEGRNGRFRRGWADVDGVPTQFEQYSYQLRTYEGTRTVYQSIGTDAEAARNRRETVASKRKALQASKAAGLVVVQDDQRKTLAKAVAEYVARAEGHGHLVAARLYRLSLERFQESAPDVTYVDQITESTLVRFHAHLRKRYGNSDQSVANSHKHVRGMLLWCGWPGGQEMKRRIGPVPQYDKKLIVTYDRDELSTLFAHVEKPSDSPNSHPSYDQRYFYTVLRILQMSGMREQEATHLAWTDIDFKREEIKITAKRDLNFRIKNRKDRVIPLPSELATILRERRKVVPTARLVVGTPEDRPNNAGWLRTLKVAAHNAKLDCGHCDWVPRVCTNRRVVARTRLLALDVALVPQNLRLASAQAGIHHHTDQGLAGSLQHRDHHQLFGERDIRVQQEEHAQGRVVIQTSTACW